MHSPAGAGPARQLYLADLERMERAGVVGPGTVVAADNVVYPGAPGFLEHVQVTSLLTSWVVVVVVCVCVGGGGGRRGRKRF